VPGERGGSNVTISALALYTGSPVKAVLENLAFLTGKEEEETVQRYVENPEAEVCPDEFDQSDEHIPPEFR